MPLVPLRPGADLAEWSEQQQAAVEGAVDRDGIRSAAVIQRRLPGLITTRAAQTQINSMRRNKEAMCVFDDGTQIPWSAIEATSRVLGGLPEPVREELGTANAADGDAAVAKLKAKFPDFPARQFAKNRDLLISDMIDPGPRAFYPDDFQPTLMMMNTKATGGGVYRPSQSSQSSPTDVDRVVQVAIDLAKCFLRGSWDGLVRGLPFGAGWVGGWSVCMDHKCAAALADLLLGFGGGTEFLKIVKTGVMQGVQASVKLITAMTAAVAIMIYSALLALNIKAVNKSKGVCLHGNWPAPGGVGAFVWARPR